VGQREILDKDGKATGKMEKYMYFKAQEGEDIGSLSKQTGISLEELKKGLGDVEIKEGTVFEKFGIGEC